MTIAFWGSVIAYGWLIQEGVNLAAPLVMQFISALSFRLSDNLVGHITDARPFRYSVGFTCVAIMQVSGTILVDLVCISSRFRWFISLSA